MNGYIVDEPDFIKVKENKLHKGCCEVLGCPIHKRNSFKKEETSNALASINLSAEDEELDEGSLILMEYPELMKRLKKVGYYVSLKKI